MRIASRLAKIVLMLGIILPGLELWAQSNPVVARPTIHIGSSTDEAEMSFNSGTGLEFDGNDDGMPDLMIDGSTGAVEVPGDMTINGTPSPSR